MKGHDSHLFVHVPKTAGTSYRIAMEQAFPGRVAYDYGLKAPETSEIVRRHVYAELDLGRLGEALADGETILLGGHVHYSKYSALFPPVRVISFVREPIARVVAEHEHACRHNGFEGTLLEFAATTRNRNLQSSMLTGVRLEEAAFVGITERYAESLKLLKRRVGWELPVLELNVNPRRDVLGASYPLPPEVEAQLREWNAVDVAFYAEAVARFEAALGG